MSAELINEVQENYRTKLGAEFGDAYYLCLAEWVDIVGIWHQYENLFGHNQEKIDLLNEAGGRFFYNVERLFFRSVVLGLCRLIDPIKSSGKDNLTIRRLGRFMDTEYQKDRFKLLENAALTSTDFARDWRNRYIAHNDLGLKQNAAAPLAFASREFVKIAISNFHSILNFISAEFMNTDLANRVSGFNHEMDVLYRLYLGSIKEKEIQSSVDQGIFNLVPTPSWYSIKV
jgi:AbiU2